MFVVAKKQFFSSQLKFVREMTRGDDNFVNNILKKFVITSLAILKGFQNVFVEIFNFILEKNCG